jgi:hypothetical protein
VPFVGSTEAFLTDSSGLVRAPEQIGDMPRCHIPRSTSLRALRFATSQLVELDLPDFRPHVLAAIRGSGFSIETGSLAGSPALSMTPGALSCARSPVRPDFGAKRHRIQPRSSKVLLLAKSLHRQSAGDWASWDPRGE